MSQHRSSRGRKKQSPYLFMFLCLVLLIALVIVGARAMNTWNAYQTEAAITPVPTATVRPISVTPDPNRATPTPLAPTAPPAPHADAQPFGLRRTGPDGGRSANPIAGTGLLYRQN